MRDTCSICGAAISENNPDGIGFGCRNNILHPAQKDWRFKAHGLDLWAAKCEVLMKRFIETFGEHKFRKEGFRKSFTLSIISQWTERKLMSKKQFDIVLKFLEEKHIWMGEDFNFVFKDWCREYSPHRGGPEYAFYLERFDMHKKLYLSGRKGRILENVPVAEETE